MSHVFERAPHVPVADQILIFDSPGIAPVMGPVGPVPPLNVGYLDVLCRDPNLGNEFHWLCHI